MDGLPVCDQYWLGFASYSIHKQTPAPAVASAVRAADRAARSIPCNCTSCPSRRNSTVNGLTLLRINYQFKLLTISSYFDHDRQNPSNDILLIMTRFFARKPRTLFYFFSRGSCAYTTIALGRHLLRNRNRNSKCLKTATHVKQEYSYVVKSDVFFILQLHRAHSNITASVCSDTQQTIIENKSQAATSTN